MFRSALVFLLGFSFGVATITTFRHEVGLTSRAGTATILLIAGGFYAGVTLVWLIRLRALIRNTSQSFAVTAEWGHFVWGSLTLLIIYLTLVIVFLRF